MARVTGRLTRYLRDDIRLDCIGIQKAEVRNFNIQTVSAKMPPNLAKALSVPAMSFQSSRPVVVVCATKPIITGLTDLQRHAETDSGVAVPSEILI